MKLAKQTKYEIIRRGSLIGTVTCHLLDEALDKANIRNGDVLKSPRGSWVCDVYGWVRL